jgi:hypothetical protein
VKQRPYFFFFFAFFFIERLTSFRGETHCRRDPYLPFFFFFAAFFFTKSPPSAIAQ